MNPSSQHYLRLMHWMWKSYTLSAVPDQGAPICSINRLLSNTQKLTFVLWRYWLLRESSLGFEYYHVVGFRTHRGGKAIVSQTSWGFGFSLLLPLFLNSVILPHRPSQLRFRISFDTLAWSSISCLLHIPSEVLIGRIRPEISSQHQGSYPHLCVLISSAWHSSRFSRCLARAWRTSVALTEWSEVKHEEPW